MYKFFKRIYYWLRVIFYAMCLIMFVLFSSCSAAPAQPCIMASSIEQTKGDRIYVSASIRCDKPFKVYINNPFNNMPAKSVLNSDHPIDGYNYHFWINSDEYNRLVLTYDTHKGHS